MARIELIFGIFGELSLIGGQPILLHVTLVPLEETEGLRVGTPSNGTVHRELLLIDPVGHTVDDLISGAIIGHLALSKVDTCRHHTHIEKIVVAHKDELTAVGSHGHGLHLAFGETLEGLTTHATGFDDIVEIVGLVTTTIDRLAVAPHEETFLVLREFVTRQPELADIEPLFGLHLVEVEQRIDCVTIAVLILDDGTTIGGDGRIVLAVGCASESRHTLAAIMTTTDSFHRDRFGSIECDRNGHDCQADE